MGHRISKLIWSAGILLIPFCIQSQTQFPVDNPWVFVEKGEQTEEFILLSRGSDIFPARNYFLFEMDSEAMANLLQDAPKELARNFESEVVIPIPTGENSYENFRLAESPVFAPELSDDFPNIKSYKAISEQNSGRSGRISFTNRGFLGVFNSSNGEIYIEKFQLGEGDQYVLYYSTDVVVDENTRQSLSCGYDHYADEILEEFGGRSAVGVEYNSAGGELLELRVYRMAIAATSAYSNQKGGTVESVMASFNESLNLLNQITENEVAIRFELIPNNQLLIWLSPGDEPFVNLTSGGGLLSQATPAINGAGIPLSAFDVGHVFTGGCSDVGGVVSGRACSPGKARGVTCHSSNNMSFIVNRIFAHEVGHQFGVAHSWNFCPGNDGQRAGNSAFEPGSGSTIMSYAGSCGDQNIQSNNHAYFHSGSIQEWFLFSRILPDNQDCGERIFTGNTEPVVSLPYENGFYIPINTPFKLRAEAFDEDGDEITYCWEQMDIGPSVPLGEPRDNAPLFRTFPPNNSPVRYFPDLATLRNNANDPTQQLPGYSRSLNFRSTVRDNNPTAGATVWADVSFKSTASAGPFVVTYPSSLETFKTGELIEVQWDVANTNSSPVNCGLVDILLSTNGGLSFPITLVERTPNTGSALVQLPNNTGTTHRVKVRASDNIFFNISRPNFRIEEAEEPAFIFRHQPGYGLICLPDQVSVNFTLEPILGFSDTVKVEMISELPPNARLINFPETIVPGTSGEFTIDMNETRITETYELEFRLTTENDTLYRSVFFETMINDFDDLELTGPEDGVSGVGQTIDFLWNPSVNADFYEVEIATNPTFEEEYMIHREITPGTHIQPNIFFPASTLVYWRIRPFNRCGAGGYTSTAVFQTLTKECKSFEAQDLPLNTPTGADKKATSVITIDDNAEVTQLRIPKLEGLQSWVGDIGFTLISPSGTRVRLFTRRCSNLSHYKLGFDDNSPIELGCPLTSGRIYQPQEPLAAFEGESLEGAWVMEYKRFTSGQAGRWDAWNMEVCANTNLSPLSFINKDTLFAPPLKRTHISRDLLRMDVTGSSEEVIVYTVVEAPKFGSLIFGEEDRGVGLTFTQRDIRDGIVRYRADVEEEADDSFKFTVINDRNEWAGIETFHIAIREDAISSSEEIVDNRNIELFPNPTTGIINLKLAGYEGELIYYQLFTIDGKLLNSGEFRNAGLQQLDFTGISAGMYIIEINTGNSVETMRVIID